MGDATPTEASGDETTAGGAAATEGSEITSASASGDEAGAKFDLANEPDDPPEACACDGSLDGIYVFHNAGAFGIGITEIHFFDPLEKSFSLVGELDCPAPLGWTASSMTVDRSGRAWVSYYDIVTQSAKLFRAPLSDLSACEEAPYVPPGEGWWLVGMGHATTDAIGNCDDLFIYNSDRHTEYPNFSPGGSELARYDERSGMLEIVGPTAYPTAELSGSGDGQLLAFAAVDEASAVLAVLDTATGASLEHVVLEGVDTGSSFAFAFWGGDVYLFTPGEHGGRSQVTRVDHDQSDGGGTELHLADAGLLITGAGVSTCASFEPPG